MLSSGAGGGDIITGAEVLRRGMDGAEDRGGGGAVITGGEKVVLVVGAAIVATVAVSSGADTGAWRGGGTALT